MFLRLRWLSIVVPVVLVAAIETISDTLLDAQLPFPLDAILIALVVLATAAALSWLAFREIGRLTRALQARNAELTRHSATARALEEVAVSVASGAELTTALHSVVSRARDLLQADVGGLIAFVPGVAPVRLVQPPDAVPGAIEPETSVEMQLAGAGFASVVSAPIRLGSAVVGSLTTGRRDGGAFDVGDVETLTALASLAAVAIRNHDLRTAARALAVRGERERIAREMHDGLAQVLAYASAKSAAAEELLAAGRAAEAQEQMAELGRVARATYVDVRESILGLATPVSPEHGLAAALEEYGRQVAEAAKLAVVVSATDGARAAELTPESEAQAFRIVQEALTNVRKHASAARADVLLTLDAGTLVVSVEDDGRGFSAHVGGAQDWPHYGLATMTARAAEAGGTVSWSPRPTGGTRVELRVPVMTTPRVAPATAAAAGGAGAAPGAS
jgi:signal transduction histidine kinase